MDLSRIDKILYVSEAVTARNIALLIETGIKFVCNMSLVSDTNTVAQYISNGIGYRHYPIRDEPEKNILGPVNIIYKQIMKNQHAGATLVHCSWGRSRSGAAAVYYLMMRYHLNVNCALARARIARSGIQPNPGFYVQLTDYYSSILTNLHSYKDQEAKIDAITDRIYISDYATACNIPHLLFSGVSVVINVTSQEKPENVTASYKKHNIVEYQYSINDESDEKILPVAEEVHRIITEAPFLGILVHCNAGMSRSASVVIWHLMNLENLDYDTVLTRVRVYPNDGFAEQLRAAWIDKKNTEITNRETWNNRI